MNCFRRGGATAYPPVMLFAALFACRDNGETPLTCDDVNSARCLQSSIEEQSKHRNTLALMRGGSLRGVNQLIETS